MPKFNKSSLWKVFYVLLTILPSILTGTFYNNFTSQKLSSTASSSIKALGNSLNKQLEQLASSIYYSLDLMTDADSFETLDIAGISQSVNLFNFYNPNACSNIFIVDENMNTIYGVNDNLINNISYSDHIKSAFSGRAQNYYSSDPTPFAQLTFPIFSHDDPTKVIAVLVATFNLNIFSDALMGISDINSNYTGYIISTTGNSVIATSLPSTVSVPATLNIEDIRMSLKYSKDQTFIDYNGEKMYGSVFFIKRIGSYLLITTPASNTATNYLDYLSYIFGALGAGTITTTEVLRKKRSTNAGVDPSPDPDPSQSSDLVTQLDTLNDISSDTHQS